MIIIKTAEILQKTLSEKFSHQPIGFVPTMGALHKGHLELIKNCLQQNNICVCSIFVNPTQFNNPTDFAKYPTTLEQDIFLLEQAGCHILFLPDVEEIYPNGTTQLPFYDIGYLDTILEGKYRPGHFQGVCAVVHILLEMVQPQTLYLGQKDYQQCMVIQKLISLIPSLHHIKITIIPTLRENSGLAMSSRNLRLTDTEKEKATAIYKGLTYLKNNQHNITVDAGINYCEQLLKENGFNKIDYIAICNANNLSEIKNFKDNVPKVALFAAFLGEVRLIDNMLLQ